MTNESPLILDASAEVEATSPTRPHIGGPKGLALIFLLALAGTIAGNAIYDLVCQPERQSPGLDQDRTSAGYLGATRARPIDYASVEQASADFYENFDQAAIPYLLDLGAECWAAYDAAPTWAKYDYCLGFDMVLSFHASPQEVQAHVPQAAGAPLVERRTEKFQVSKAKALDGELAVAQRATHIAASIQIEGI
jgi:hypothetical protein